MPNKNEQSKSFRSVLQMSPNNDTAKIPQPLKVELLGSPRRHEVELVQRWWERFPVAIGISIFALVASLVPFFYSVWPAREEASVALIRWVTPLTPDNAMHPQVWLAIANRGNRDIIVFQAPFMYQADRENMAFADETPLDRQSDPVVIEPGKSAVVRVSTEIAPSVMDKAKMLPDQQRSDEKGSKSVVRLALSVVVAHPNSGKFSSALTNCLRVMMYENQLARAEADPRFVDLKFSNPGEKIPVEKYPCLNDLPAPRVTQ